MGVAAAAVYGACRLAAALGSSAVATPDSHDYAAQSQYSLLDGRFWASQHPPLLPLVWKLVPGAIADHGARIADPRALVLVDVAIGAAAWLFLATVAASCFQRTALRASAFVGVLLLSLSPEIAGWDAALLSESLSLSLTAVLCACVVLYLRRQTRARAVAVAATVVAACASRDTELALCVALVVGLVLVVPRQRLLLVGGLTLAAAVVLWGNHASDRRWQVPLRNSIAFAIDSEHAGPWFAGHGLPAGSESASLLREQPTERFETDPRTAQLRHWLDRHGRRTWYRYLAEHPGYVAWPIEHVSAVVDGNTAADGVDLEDSVLFTLSPYVHGIEFWILVLGAAVSAFSVRRRTELVVAGAAAMGAAAAMLVVPTLDRYDVQRHLVVVQVSLRLVLGALVLVGVERLLASIGGGEGCPRDRPLLLERPASRSE